MSAYFRRGPEGERGTVDVDGLGRFTWVHGYWEAELALGAGRTLSVQVESGEGVFTESTASAVRAVLDELATLESLARRYYAAIPDEARSSCGAIELDGIMLTPGRPEKGPMLSFQCADREDAFVMIGFAEGEPVEHLFAD